MSREEQIEFTNARVMITGGEFLEEAKAYRSSVEEHHEAMRDMVEEFGVAGYIRLGRNRDSAFVLHPDQDYRDLPGRGWHRLPTLKDRTVVGWSKNSEVAEIMRNVPWFPDAGRVFDSVLPKNMDFFNKEEDGWRSFYVGTTSMPVHTSSVSWVKDEFFAIILHPGRIAALDMALDPRISFEDKWIGWDLPKGLIEITKGAHEMLRARRNLEEMKEVAAMSKQQRRRHDMEFFRPPPDPAANTIFKALIPDKPLPPLDLSRCKLVDTSRFGPRRPEKRVVTMPMPTDPKERAKTEAMIVRLQEKLDEEHRKCDEFEKALAERDAREAAARAEWNRKRAAAAEAAAPVGQAGKAPAPRVRAPAKEASESVSLDM